MTPHRHAATIVALLWTASTLAASVETKQPGEPAERHLSADAVILVVEVAGVAGIDVEIDRIGTSSIIGSFDRFAERN